MPANPWAAVGLLAFAGAITAASRYCLGWPGMKPTLRSLVSDLVWILLMGVGGLIAMRYVERAHHTTLAWAHYATVAWLFSLARAVLYSRVGRMRARVAALEAAPVRPGARRRAALALQAASRAYAVAVILTVLGLALAAAPVAASDLFRMPYSRAWTTINRTLDRLRYTYNPPGGGEAPTFPPWRNPGDAGLDYRDVTLLTSDGLELTAWYIPAAKACAPSILLAHGLQDSKWTMLRLVPWLHHAGYNVLMFDFRGHGGSDRQPTTLGREEVADVQAALDWLEAEGISNHIYALGMSLGAAALVNTAAVDGRLDGLILDSLFAEWQNVDYARDYRLPPEWLVPDVPNPVDVIRRVNVPVLIIHGTADILVHADHAERLFAAANEPKQLWINDSGHAWSAWTYPDVFQAKVLAFLESTVRRGEPVCHEPARRIEQDDLCGSTRGLVNSVGEGMDVVRARGHVSQVRLAQLTLCTP